MEKQGTDDSSDDREEEQLIQLQFRGKLISEAGDDDAMILSSNELAIVIFTIHLAFR